MRDRSLAFWLGLAALALFNGWLGYQLHDTQPNAATVAVLVLWSAASGVIYGYVVGGWSSRG